MGSALQATTEVADGCCLLDLPVAEAAYSIPSQHSDLYLSSTIAMPSGQLFRYNDASSQNGDDESIESDHIPVDRLSISDNGALLTLNGTGQSESAACANRLSTDNGADILSKIDEALNSHLDTTSEAV